MATKMKTDAAPVAAPSEETEADAAASVEVGAGPEAGAEAAAPVATEEVTPQLIEDAIDAEADGAVSAEPGPGHETDELEVPSTEAGAATNADTMQGGDPDLAQATATDVAQPIHQPSAIRIAIQAIESRNNDWQSEQLLDELVGMGAEIPFSIERGTEATMALFGIEVTSHLGREFLLNYWAAQARQALLGRAA